jgi:hypothetical protein
VKYTDSSVTDTQVGTTNVIVSGGSLIKGLMIREICGCLFGAVCVFCGCLLCVCGS